MDRIRKGIGLLFLCVVLAAMDCILWQGELQIEMLLPQLQKEAELPEAFREMKVARRGAFEDLWRPEEGEGLGRLALWWCKGRETYQELEELYGDIQKSFQSFPLPRKTSGQQEFAYENGFMEGRSFGGQRRHEGTDLMSASGRSGEIPVLSASEGTVEKLGWLKLGGYRVGIRSSEGVYYYYAHLDRYAPLSAGDSVKPGDVLGYMGDTGYGPEGTRGKFPVHLHFGIYVDYCGEEISVNPYWLLRQREA